MIELKFRMFDKDLHDPMLYFSLEEVTGFIASRIGSHPVMQYTGIKDKNGKDCYSGDLIAFVIPTTGRKRIAEVVFYEGKLKFCKHIIGRGEKYSGLTKPGRTQHNFEIVGNIYQNPELLKTYA